MNIPLFSKFTSKLNSSKPKKRMRFLGNIKTAPKLLSGFLLIALLCAIVGGYAASSIQQLGFSSRQMYEEILLPVRSAGNVNNQFKDAAYTFRKLLLTDSDDHSAPVLLAAMDNYLLEVSHTISDIETAAINTIDASQIQELKDAFEQYKDIANQALSKAQSDDVFQQIIGRVSYLSNLNEAENTLQQSIEKLEQDLSYQAESINAQNISKASGVLSFTIASICATFMLAVLTGIFFSRSISKPINKLTVRAKKLAAGDTEFDISGNSSKDEIGQMREAIKTILESIRTLSDDTKMLIDAAAQGQLSVRADENKHQGVYREIVEGINKTLDSMITPIYESSKVLNDLSQGNLNVRVKGDFAGDFAIVKNALNDTVETLRNYISEITDTLGSISNGILNVSIDSKFKGDFAILKQSINMSIDSFNKVLNEINIASEEVAVSSSQLSNGSQVISRGATEQASALEQLTVSISEISEKTKNNAKGASDSNALSLEAMDIASKGNEKMKLLESAMEEINESSANISKIIKVIDDIAFQTNILALNAAVEAARAGVHGKGFAVVAEEVRSLASRSAKAAKQTAELIAGSINKMEAGTVIADETAAALASIVEVIQKTVELSGEISNASNEQATGIVQVDKGIEQLSQVVQSSSATAQETAASSEELAAQAENLKNMVSRFSLKQNISNSDDDNPDYTEGLAVVDSAERSDNDNPEGFAENSWEENYIEMLPDDEDYGKY